MPKIITSECCELVKLCDINCSDPVFFRHTVFYAYKSGSTENANKPPFPRTLYGHTGRSRPTVFASTAHK